jgi:hypothetical protein
MQNKIFNHGDTETQIKIILRAFASPWFFRVLLWLAPILFLLSYFFLPLSKILFLAIGGIVQLLGLYEVLGRFLYHGAVSDGLGIGSIVVDKLFAAFEVSLGPGDGLFFEL